MFLFGKKLAVLPLAAALLLASSGLRAQEMKYKPGDRIEVDIIQSSNPTYAKYKKATVVDLDPKDKIYIVDIDPLPGKLPDRMRVMVRSYGPHWIRPIGGADNGGPKLETDTLRVDADNTVLADRAVMDCARQRPSPARNGQPLPADVGKRLIRCLAEKPSEPGMDGATTVDILEYKPGTPRRWDRREDTAFAGTTDSWVYPVHVKFTRKVFYRTYNDVTANREQLFTCYVEVDHWYCGYSVLFKEGEKRQIRVK